MTARGLDFLENWIERNVTAGGPPDDPDERFSSGNALHSRSSC
jgi:hypothetical protein